MALTVRGLVERMGEALALTVLGSPEGLSREIPTSDASGPGLVLAGYTGRFVHQRVQVLGETEITYLAALDEETRRRNLRTYFGYPLPCVMVTKGQSLPEGMDDEARRAGVSLLISGLNTREFYRIITPFLENEFSPSISLHGSLADVSGVGLLFTGESGIGKSECVLDLVERGHRLVADDLVLARRKGADIVIGRGHELQRHFMEIRGVGLIDVSAIFGIHSVRQQKRIEVVVDLVVWDKNLQVDRTGLDGQTVNILGVDLPKITVPLNPGKNITVISEVIAMNHLLRYTGVDAAHSFNERLKAKMVQRAGDVRKYLLDDDE